MTPEWPLILFTFFLCLSGGSLGIFFTRPITCVLMIIFFAIILVSVLRPILAKKKGAAA